MSIKESKTLDLSKLSDDELLNLRICDLPIQISGTWLEECIQQLYKELEEKGIVFRPECYLADEWLTPENETVIGIPFYLADPSLMRLEQKMMLEVEGGSKDWCMKLLRHETGHAISYAYRLNKRKKWQSIFGSSKTDYPETYRFRPYSKSFVRHLEDFYAQYHPDEDFVETFAVWLTPNSHWQEKYQGWKAIRKLNYVDKVINELKEKNAPVKNAQKHWRLSILKRTLQNHYKKKRRFWEEDFPEFHDVSLRKIFIEKTNGNRRQPLASKVLSQYRRDIVGTVHTWTRERKYVISDVLKRVNKRCRTLKLVVPDSEPLAVMRTSSYITTLIMNYAYTGKFKGEKIKRKK